MSRGPGSGRLEERFFPGNLVSEMGEAIRQQRRLGRRGLTARAAAEGYQARWGMFLDGWYQATVAASQSAVALNRWGAASYWQKVAFGRDGYVTWLQARLDAPLTAGSCTVEVWINGAASGLAVVLDGEEPSIVEASGETEFGFAAGEEIELRVTTSGFAPTAANLLCMIGVRLG